MYPCSKDVAINNVTMGFNRMLQIKKIIAIGTRNYYVFISCEVASHQ